jgi:hypothetical protein
MKTIIDQLLNAGADPSRENDRGNSAINLAEQLDLKHLREDLLRNYNYVNIKQVYGDEAQDTIDKMLFSDDMGHHIYDDMGNMAIPKDYWLEKQRYETEKAKKEYLGRVKKGTIALMLLAGGLMIPGAFALGQLPNLVSQGSTTALVTGGVATISFLSNHFQGHGDDGRSNMLIAIQHHTNVVKKMISSTTGQVRSLLKKKYESFLSGLSKIGKWLTSLDNEKSFENTKDIKLSEDERNSVLFYNYNVSKLQMDTYDSPASSNANRFAKDIDSVLHKGISI